MNDEIHAILQTGRLGDLWFTVPLADRLASLGHQVEVWYDEIYGDPFVYFPSVIARPAKLARVVPGSGRAARLANAAAQQLLLYARLRRLGRRVVWNQVYPFRLLAAYRSKQPYPYSWYRRYPGLDFRRAHSTLPLADDGTILYFAASASLRIGAASPFAPWLEANLELLETRTGYRVLYVPPPGEPDHPRFPTWRGDLDAYQRLIARCGLVFGISTSAHVLAQLLGKPVVACYADRRRIVDTIGGETAKLYPGELLDAAALARFGRD